MSEQSSGNETAREEEDSLVVNTSTIIPERRQFLQHWRCGRTISATCSNELG